MFTQQEYDSDTEFPSHKLNFDTYCSDLCSKALLSRRSSGPKNTDVILDTGGNGSIVHNLELLHDVRSSPQLTFEGLAGSLHIRKKGHLRDLCSAHHHADSPANILSFSQL